MRLLRRMVLLLVVAAGLFYVAVCVLLYVQQRAFVFPGAVPWPHEPLLDGASLVRVSVNGVEGLGLHRPAEGDRPTVVLFHGNGSSVPSEVPFARQLVAKGAGVLLVEYPGYGPVAGAPSEEALLSSARALLDHVALSPSKVVLFGHSLGTGVAARMAAEGRGARLVLVAPYTSLPDVGAAAFRFVPVRLLMKDRFETRSLAPKLTLPVLIVHGARDDVIPVEMGRELARTLPDARLVELPRGDHYPQLDALDEIARFVVDPEG